jgi:hypothetical protein
MQIIIESEFLESFYILHDAKNATEADFSRFLTAKLQDFCLVTDFEDLDALQAETMENPMWEMIVDRLPRTEFSTTLKQDIEQPNFYTQDSIFKLFCTTKSDTECKALEEKYGYTYLNINTLKNKWAVYQSDRDDNPMPIDTTSNPRFDSWTKIQTFRHPISTMVIFDKYLFVNSINQDINQNLLELLKNLIPDVALNQPLEILFLVAKETNSSKNIDKSNRLMPSTTSINDRMILIGQHIESFFTTNYHNLTVKVSIAHYDKTDDPTTDKEHDRGIYTNYFFFEIGAGINLFDGSNALRNRSTFNAHFLLKLPGKNVGFSGLRSFRDYIQNVVTTHGASSLEYFYNFGGSHALLNDIHI